MPVSSTADEKVLALLHQQSISTLRALYQDGDVSPADVVESALRHALEVQDDLNAFAYLDHEGARVAAKNSAERWAIGRPLSPLDGIPVTVKEFANVKGWQTRRASLATPQDLANEDAIFVARLKGAGAILLGKTRSPEFNWKGTTDSPGFGITRNPLNRELTSGGSSGGCAAAVASGVVRLSFGSDAGGSVRIPAAFCGIVGLKPTFGSIPLTPYPTAFAELAHIGPLGVDCSEIAAALALVRGPAAVDWTSWRVTHPNKATRSANQKWRLAVLHRRYWSDADPVVVSSMERFLLALDRSGTHVVEVNIDVQSASRCAADLYRLACYRLVQSLPANSRSLVDKGLIDWVAPMAAFSLDDHFGRMQQRSDWGASLRIAMQDVDALILPSTPVRAFAAGRNAPSSHDQHDWFSWNPYTPAFNLSHNPALSFPIQAADDGLPVGLQLVGHLNEDDTLLELASFILGLNG